MLDLEFFAVINGGFTLGIVFWLYRKNLIHKYTRGRQYESVWQEMRNMESRIDSRIDSLSREMDHREEEARRDIDYWSGNLDRRLTDLEDQSEKSTEELNSRIPL